MDTVLHDIFAKLCYRYIFKTEKPDAKTISGHMNRLVSAWPHKSVAHVINQFFKWLIISILYNYCGQVLLLLFLV